jgi:hypothetical protein
VEGGPRGERRVQLFRAYYRAVLEGVAHAWYARTLALRSLPMPNTPPRIKFFSFLSARSRCEVGGVRGRTDPKLTSRGVTAALTSGAGSFVVRSSARSERKMQHRSSKIQKDKNKRPSFLRNTHTPD